MLKKHERHFLHGVAWKGARNLFRACDPWLGFYPRSSVLCHRSLVTTVTSGWELYLRFSYFFSWKTSFRVYPSKYNYLPSRHPRAYHIIVWYNVIFYWILILWCLCNGYIVEILLYFVALDLYQISAYFMFLLMLLML